MSWSAPEDWSRWDPDKLMVCPYDEAHMIKAKRFQYHLLKCRENHPEKDFVNCPFNAKHVMLRHELRQHVSRCPDRSVIEHYNYKGSEKDEDGFYFKGNTSVPSYHRTEELQEPSESWDNHDVEGNHQQSHHNNVERSLPHQGSSQMSTMVTDTLSLSPEDRDRFKQQMRREAAQRSANSGTRLPSRMCSTSQGYNTNVDIHGQQYSPRTNPVFRHCVEQGAISSLSQQQVGCAPAAPVLRAQAHQQVGSVHTAPVSRAQAHQQVGSLHTAPVSRAHAPQQAHYEYDSNLAQSGSIANDVPQPRNRIFQHCLEKIHESQQAREPQTVFEQYNTQLIHGDRNFVKHRGADETVSSHHTSKTQPLSPADANPEFRSGVIESDMENRFKLIVRGTSGVGAVSNVCGQPTSPTSAGVNSPQLAGVGRARLHAEARKNNFGGICFSPPKATEIPTTRTPPVGRGRGMLNFMYSS